MNLTYSYHSEFEDIVNFIEKGNEAQRLIPSANVKMKIPNTVSIPHTITDLDNIVKFKINDDIDKPNIDNALMYDRIFEISYRGASTEITDQIC